MSQENGLSQDGVVSSTDPSPWVYVQSETQDTVTIELNDKELDILSSVIIGDHLRRGDRANDVLISRVEAPRLIDSLYRALTNTTIWNDGTEVGFRTQLSKLIVKLARTFDHLPSSLFVTVDSVSPNAVAFGGFADIYEGVYHGRRVALKRLRVWDGTQKDVLVEKLCREVINWHYLQHSNVLPFLGLEASDVSVIAHTSMVSPWMENGNMLNFIIKEDLRPAELKRLLSETAQGLHYLHSQSIVHGDLRCSNILIDTGKHAQLADFGLSLMAEGTGITSNATRTTGSWRWNAPELFLDAVRNTQTDVYAFGCLCLEAFTRQHPFPDIAYDHQVVFAISRGRRLTRPSQLDLGASTIDSIWDLTDQCWDSDAARRPTAKQVSEVMVDMLRQSPLDEIATGTALVHPESVDFGWGADDILEIAMEYDPILFFTELDIQVKYVIVEAPLRLCITRSDAGKLIDFVCEILLHSFPPPNPTQKKHFIAVLTELIHHSRHLPAALCVRGIQRTPEYPRSGIWADIHKGLLQSRVVALKRYSDYHTTKKRFIHAMLVWKAAEHPHVLPLTGLDVGTFDPAVWTVTVTPWMNNGNLVEYIDRQRVGNAKIHRLLLEAAEALQYLHSESIVHGNLRGWYIYVDRWKHARLAGFDFAAIVGDGSPQRRTAQLACEWTAPEAFLPEFRQYTIASDVWSFACTCLEAFTLLAPFPNLDSEYEVIRHLTRGGKPERPAAPYVLRPHAELISDRLWRLLELCWATEPAMRPSMSFVVDALEDIGGDWIRVQDVVPRRSASVRGGIATPTS